MKDNIMIQQINFKKFPENRSNLKWDLNPKVNILTGNNSSGKTRLLTKIKCHHKQADYIGCDTVAMTLISTFYQSFNALSDLHKTKVFTAINFFLNQIGKYIDEDGFFLLKTNKKVNELALTRNEIRLMNLILAVAQSDKPIILIDDIETGLSVNWQGHLIRQLMIVAPESQFIIATKSPAIIMNGWNDVYVNIEELKEKS